MGNINRPGYHPRVIDRVIQALDTKTTELSQNQIGAGVLVLHLIVPRSTVV